MSSLSRVMLISIILCTSVALAAANQAEKAIDFSGKWLLQNSERHFTPNTIGRSPGPAAGPMGGGDVDVRMGGAGGYEGGEGRSGSGAANDAPKDLTLKIEQSAAEIKLERTWTKDAQPYISHETFSLDGKEKLIRDAAGNVDTKAKAKWRKEALLIESVQKVSGRGRSIEIKSRQEFSLSKDGQQLTIKTSQESPSGEVVSKQVFKKS